MRQIQGLSEDQVLEIIEEVVSKLSNKLPFSIYDMEDIKQEGRILAMEGLNKFDEERFTVEEMYKGVECFLRVHVNKRIRNHRRDNLGRTEKPVNPARIEAWEKRNQIRHNIMYPVDIHDLTNDIPLRNDVVEEANYSQLIELINKELSPDLRTDFLRMCDGVRIPKGRQIKVREAIAEIIKEGIPDEES